MKEKTNIRIIDIARMAGVSAGTVDRVLHKRGRVSDEKRSRVEAVLKKIDYEPNIAARFLASKRKYRIAVISPLFYSGDYWELVCEGMDRAAAEFRKFNLEIEYFRFDQYDRNSFAEAVTRFREKEFDGVLIATLFGEHAVALSAELDRKRLPYIYIDSAIPNQNDLAYFGGDSFGSGAIAAKLLLKEVGPAADIFFAHVRFKRNEISVQMKTREQGFMDCLRRNDFSGRVHHVEIDPDDHARSLGELERIVADGSELTGGIVLNSRIYALTGVLREMERGLRARIRLVGYDAIERNAAALKNDEVSFLLSQRPELQGYDAVKAMGNYLLFGQTPGKVNHMPVDILIKENVECYNNYKY